MHFSKAAEATFFQASIQIPVRNIRAWLILKNAIQPVSCWPAPNRMSISQFRKAPSSP